ncbi:MULTISPECIES: hypothetical protein [unclassified Desulfovibrio]|uniref:hypothetical protein n=1 Tax=unclassified Desulfovibrio TaxID=2593640 RepID=UPI0013EC759C|nr:MULTISPECIES: hypothetical protein [unclassified Desulfovibrio]
MEEASISEIVRDCVIRDYFTPNVTAETTIGCLIRPRLAYIVNRQCGLKTIYVAKEMSIPLAAQHRDNRGFKIDYVLADDACVYLTELKTTPASISATQLAHYEAACGQWTFGESLGKQLLKILAKEYPLGRIKESAGDDGAFARCFKRITNCDAGETGNVERALECVRTLEYAWRPSNRSKKYLLTLAELLDYLGGGKKSLWHKPMKIIYLAPGSAAAELDSPHIPCLPTLEGALPPLLERGDAYSLMLADILKHVTDRKNSVRDLAG